MKKVLAILCAVLMVFAFAACGGNKNGRGSVKNNADLESYLAENEEDIAEGMLYEMGVSGECDVYVDGNGFVFEIKTSFLDDISDEDKAEMISSSGELSENLDEVVEDMKDDDKRLKDVEYLTLVLMDSDGKVIFTVSSN